MWLTVMWLTVLVLRSCNLSTFMTWHGPTAETASCTMIQSSHSRLVSFMLNKRHINFRIFNTFLFAFLGQEMVSTTTPTVSKEVTSMTPSVVSLKK